MDLFIFNFRHFIIPTEVQSYLSTTKKIQFDFAGFDRLPLSTFNQQEKYWLERISNEKPKFLKSFQKAFKSVVRPTSDTIETHRHFLDYIKELIRWRSKNEIIDILTGLYPESQKHFELIQKSKSFCTAPWFGLNIHPAGKIYPCCAYDQKEPLGNLAQHQLEDIRQGSGIQDLKTAFLDKKRMSGCQSCYNSDDAGGDNLKEHLKDIHLIYTPLISVSDRTKEKLPLLYLDVQFSNTCNLKCRICGPDFSSSWVKDYETLYNLTEHPFKPKSIKRSYPDKWSTMLKTIQEVDEVYFWGGEPLLMTEHYEFLEQLIQSGRDNVRLRYSTNFSDLTAGHWNVVSLWRKFNRMTIGASLDGTRERGELMRKNLNWNKVLENRKRLSEEVPHARFFIACATSAYNIWHISDFFQEWVELGYIDEKDFCVNLLYEPTRLSVQILPPVLKKQVTEKIHKMIDQFIRPKFGPNTVSEQRFRAAVHHMNAQDQSHLLPEFVWYNNNVDQLRTEDLLKTFPELTPIFESVSPEQINSIHL